MRRCRRQYQWQELIVGLIEVSTRVINIPSNCCCIGRLEWGSDPSIFLANLSRSRRKVRKNLDGLGAFRLNESGLIYKVAIRLFLPFLQDIYMYIMLSFYFTVYIYIDMFYSSIVHEYRYLLLFSSKVQYVLLLNTQVLRLLMIIAQPTSLPYLTLPILPPQQCPLERAGKKPVTATQTKIVAFQWLKAIA